MSQEVEEEIRIFKESHSRLLAVLRERQKRRRLQLEANEDLRKQVDTGKKNGSPDRDNKFKKNVVKSYKPYSIPSSISRKPEQEGHRKHSTDYANKGDSTSAQDGGEKTIRNDYCQYFVDSGRRPQNFIRDTELSQRFDEYPKLKELTKLKNALVSSRATPPTYLKADLRTFELKSIGTKFDVILIDPPLIEYCRKSPLIAGTTTDYWTYEEIANLKIEDVAATPSFIFIWSGDADGLDRGRQLLLKWGYRRCEDIVWIKTNKNWEGSRFFEERSVFQRTKEHCIMGIKGTVRRSTDGHFIHCNVDTDVIISEEPSFGIGTRKPEELYHIIEHFCLGRRRLELFAEDHNIRPGWLTIGNGISSSNFDANTYASYFSEQNGYLLGSTPEIEGLRPKSPPIRDPSAPKLGPGPVMKPKPKKPTNNNAMTVPQMPQMPTFQTRWITPMDGNIYGKGQ